MFMRASRCWPARMESVAGNYGRCFSSRSELAHFGDKQQSKESTYRRALKYQRPATVDGRNMRRNFVSFIGTIRRELKPQNLDRFGVHTVIDVESKPGGGAGFSILLTFWDEIGEIASEHLKPRDRVYVSGRLESYLVEDVYHGKMPNLALVVQELNFVRERPESPTPSHKPPALSETDGIREPPTFRKPAIPNSIQRIRYSYSREEMMKRRRDRLHLWHLFFASPEDWWDNRHCKRNPNAPDFKHKDNNDEALWLKDNDPPWIKEQLQLVESRLSSNNSRKGRRNSVSPLIYEDDQLH
ncbi:hypothetical protein M569_07830 [Genlisea aurea]|uniref:OB domain-containing protein n=1 Tax=Genlisea aurea TaxID=192259 RepID=S8E3V7_9LAMI|nr:hypothetical protein M569_07830 [Genlisea aurea]